MPDAHGGVGSEAKRPSANSQLPLGGTGNLTPCSARHSRTLFTGRNQRRPAEGIAEDPGMALSQPVELPFGKAAW
jgi:hypothetical protein